MTTKARGPVGSVRGIPEPEVTAVFMAVAEAIAKDGLEFKREHARDLIQTHGKGKIEGPLLDGFLFAMQRTIPGLENIGFGQYRLPKDWKLAVEHRQLRFKSPTLDIRDAMQLREILGKVPKKTVLTDGVAELIAKLNEELPE